MEMWTDSPKAVQRAAQPGPGAGSNSKPSAVSKRIIRYPLAPAGSWVTVQRRLDFIRRMNSTFPDFWQGSDLRQRITITITHFQPCHCTSFPHLTRRLSFPPGAFWGCMLPKPRTEERRSSRGHRLGFTPGHWVREHYRQDGSYLLPAEPSVAPQEGVTASCAWRAGVRSAHNTWAWSLKDLN